MPNSNEVSDDLLHMHDLFLMQRAHPIDFRQRNSRRESNERLQNFFMNLQRVLRPGITLEIGAQMATFSRKMAKLGIEAHAFEANPYNHKEFADHLRRRAGNVNYCHLAICDTDGEVTFHVKESVDGKAVSKVAGNNSLLMRASKSIVYEEVNVPARRLDSYLKENGLGDRTFSVWIDVEGALRSVIGGFGTSLSNCFSIMVEVEEVAFWENQMLVFEAMKYFAQQGFVPVARDFEYPHQYNIVYLRQDILLRPAVRSAITEYFHSS